MESKTLTSWIHGLCISDIGSYRSKKLPEKNERKGKKNSSWEEKIIWTQKKKEEEKLQRFQFLLLVFASLFNSTKKLKGKNKIFLFRNKPADVSGSCIWSSPILDSHKRGRERGDGIFCRDILRLAMKNCPSLGLVLHELLSPQFGKAILYLCLE